MIIVDTNLKKLPERCTKCKYSYFYTEDGKTEKFCSVAFYKGYNRPLRKTFNKEKHNWEYVKPDWCPLRDTEENKNKII